MQRPELSTVPEFYHKYVNLVAEENAADAIAANGAEALSFFQSIPAGKWNYRYAEGKWSIKEMVQHLIDAERIFSFRALCIARDEAQSLPGFDENAYAAASDADRRSQADLLDEFSSVRKATTLLFRSFTEEQIGKTGRANNNPITVNAIGFITAGHVKHHLQILKERYL